MTEDSNALQERAREFVAETLKMVDGATGSDHALTVLGSRCEPAMALIQSLAAALSQPAPIVAQEGWLMKSAAAHAKVCADLADKTPKVGVNDDLWWERQSALREASVILGHLSLAPVAQEAQTEREAVDGTSLAAFVASIERAMRTVDPDYPMATCMKADLQSILAALAQPTASAGVREEVAKAIRAEIYRQCEIGAGVAVEDHDTGLFEVSADLDVDGGFTNAILALNPSGEGR